MIAMLHFATLVIATMFAVLASVLLDWLLLRATFLLMRPATACRTAMRIATRTDLVRGTVQLARAFAPHR
jgi:hypothetical protein